jgi:hypothetical protein
MSELVVSSSVAVTGAATSTLLTLAGVAADAIAALTSGELSLIPAEVQDELRLQAERTRAHLLATLGRELGCRASGAMADATTAQAAEHALAEAGAAAAALQAQAPLHLIAGAHRRAGLDAGLRELRLARAAWRNGNVGEAAALAHRSGAALSATLTDAVARLADAHRLQVADTVEAVLGDMGYRVARASRPAGVGFWAEKGARVVGVAVLGDGTLVTDIAGCEGGRCELEAHELFRRLRERGIDTRREATLRHLRRDGGQLIGAARRSGRGAAGLVDAAAAMPLPAGGERTAAATPSAAATDDADRIRKATAWLRHGGTR